MATDKTILSVDLYDNVLLNADAILYCRSAFDSRCPGVL